MVKQIIIGVTKKKKYGANIIKYIANVLLVIIPCIILYMCYVLSKDVFDNKYILEKLIINKEYFRGCVKLTPKQDLIEDLHTFYRKTVFENTILPLYYNNFPSELQQSQDIEKNKYVFISMILPSTIQEEKIVKLERERLSSIAKKFEKNPLEETDLYFIKNMAKKYKINMPNEDFWTYIITLEHLVENVDIIPRSIFLAIAAKESAWGKSRLVGVDNDIFATRMEEENVVLRTNPPKKEKKKFRTIDDAVKSYYNYINYHPSYKRFRYLRNKYSKQNVNINILQLIETLPVSSKDKKSYTKDLMMIIRKNNLNKYNSLSINSNYKPVCVYFE